MDLDLIRAEIDEIDEELLRLFEKRSELVCRVAKYKKENNMAVFQGDREKYILDKAAAAVSDEMKNGVRLLFTTLMDISKCRQQQLLTEPRPFKAYSPGKKKPIAATVTRGSYSAEACNRFFDGNCDIRYFRNFDEVFSAVEAGEVDYGVLPIENSTAGNVSTTYDLMGKHRFYISKTVKIQIDHILAARAGTALADVKTVYSHEMALRQCATFLEGFPADAIPMSSTAEAAKYASYADEPCAAICSAPCAALYGLTPLAEGISDIGDNYTRFILISNRLEIPDDASVVSLSLTVPHTPGSLYRLLTRFAFCGLNLSRIESKPVPPDLSELKDDAFDFIFYLDFIGNIKSPEVVKLLNNLEDEMKYYRFLGNYAEK
ncbi:MAG: chorismate mutase [Bacteroides sp.]|nr:chorismate mutase [Eubacterium sp.]MCM1417573.1 chorismate mutase [Roseburia sp.]MCM1461716.1 chorismate mutase [Bacteroides sp.]